ncbi:hypothetical protein C1I63_06850 [Rathayibacter caricis DSM 15933]|uniref:Anti-sigma factor n=1 Tax=Rathayibacter caricis DSM 15933 TaxID=1328867 RepID=A0A2T4USU3_9MICO|nr:hypothetical protein [Rathayibacter caricis]MCJ1695888.1 hypothetical protein [Rathayibacter caricis]PTL72590.1 hypothetical protein C1I63_06850 [Rathayibacter caricis DSM 15933]
MTGTEHPGGRREELIAAALAGELSAEEAVEFDRLRSEDPTVDRELAAFGVVVDRLGALGGWEEGEGSAALRSRVLRIEEEEAPARPRRGRLALAVGAVAASVAVGALGATLLQGAGERPVAGPPGTLGAVETIAFEESTAVDVQGSVIAHTWGTETVLRASGFAVGESYDLVLVTESGERLPSGSFLGSAVEIDCEMNAAVPRESVAAVEIVAAGGDVVASAELPVVES